jgi:hypothetical protein
LGAIVAQVAGVVVIMDMLLNHSRVGVESDPHLLENACALSAWRSAIQW